MFNCHSLALDLQGFSGKENNIQQNEMGALLFVHAFWNYLSEKNTYLPLSTWEVMNHTDVAGCDGGSRERWFKEVAMQLLEFIFSDWIPG